MDSCSVSVLADYKAATQFSYHPCDTRMLHHSYRSARRVIFLRHRHGSRVPCDVHDSAIRKPGEQVRYVPNIDRKFHTSPFVAAELCNLLYENSGDCSQAPVRLLDPARDLTFQFRVVSRFNIFESPERATQPGQISFREQSSTRLSTFRSIDRSPANLRRNIENLCVSNRSESEDLLVSSRPGTSR